MNYSYIDKYGIESDIVREAFFKDHKRRQRLIKELKSQIKDDTSLDSMVQQVVKANTCSEENVLEFNRFFQKILPVDIPFAMGIRFRECKVNPYCTRSFENRIYVNLYSTDNETYVCTYHAEYNEDDELTDIRVTLDILGQDSFMLKKYNKFQKSDAPPPPLTAEELFQHKKEMYYMDEKVRKEMTNKILDQSFNEECKQNDDGSYTIEFNSNIDKSVSTLNKDKKLHGPSRRYKKVDNIDVLTYKCDYKNNEKHGVEEEYDGIVVKRTHYKNGNKDGTEQLWTKDGTLAYTKTWSNGMLMDYV